MNTPIKTILCIEDDRFIGEMYVRSLRNSGYITDWVVSGTEGLQAALTQSYDLILLDIMLPQQPGNEVLQQLRGEAGDKIPHSRVVVLTNFDQDTASHAAMQSQADAYLIKADITPRKLLQLIGKMAKKE